LKNIYIYFHTASGSTLHVIRPQQCSDEFDIAFGLHLLCGSVAGEHEARISHYINPQSSTLNVKSLILFCFNYSLFHWNHEKI